MSRRDIVGRGKKGTGIGKRSGTKARRTWVFLRKAAGSRVQGPQRPGDPPRSLNQKILTSVVARSPWCRTLAIVVACGVCRTDRLVHEIHRIHGRCWTWGDYRSGGTACEAQAADDPFYTHNPAAGGQIRHNENTGHEVAVTKKDSC